MVLLLLQANSGGLVLVSSCSYTIILSRETRTTIKSSVTIDSIHLKSSGNKSKKSNAKVKNLKRNSNFLYKKFVRIYGINNYIIGSGNSYFNSHKAPMKLLSIFCWDFISTLTNYLSKSKLTPNHRNYGRMGGEWNAFYHYNTLIRHWHLLRVEHTIALWPYERRSICEKQHGIDGQKAASQFNHLPNKSPKYIKPYTNPEQKHYTVVFLPSFEFVIQYQLRKIWKMSKMLKEIISSWAVIDTIAPWC